MVAIKDDFVKVELGSVKWVAPTGLIGISPLASVGPLTLGPSTREGSSAFVPQVLLRLDPVQSLIQGKVILQFHAGQAEVSFAFAAASLLQSLHEGAR